MTKIRFASGITVTIRDGVRQTPSPTLDALASMLPDLPPCSVLDQTASMEPAEIGAKCHLYLVRPDGALLA